MSRNKKATNIEMLERINDVYTFLLKGASRQEILEYSGQTWGIQRSQTDTYIARAYKYFNERTQIKRDTELGQALERYEMLFQKAFKVQDYKTCIQAQTRIDKIMGLEIERKEFTGKGGGAIVYKLEYPTDE